jgi:hypothetical protein
MVCRGAAKADLAARVGSPLPAPQYKLMPLSCIKTLQGVPVTASFFQSHLRLSESPPEQALPATVAAMGLDEETRTAQSALQMPRVPINFVPATSGEILKLGHITCRIMEDGSRTGLH